MLPGKEGLHSWTPPGATKAAVTLGERTDAKGKPVWPWFKIRAIPGLRSQGEAEDNADAKVGGLGLTPRRGERRGRTIVYECTIKARSLRELREAEDTLQAAFAGIGSIGRMDCTWHALNKEFEDAPPVFYEAKCLTCDIPDQQETQTWDRLFVVGFRLYDPRHSEVESKEHTFAISKTNVAVDAGTVTAPPSYSYPLLELDLPEIKPKEEGEDLAVLTLRLLNKATGKSLYLGIPQEKLTLILDFASRTITDSGGTNWSWLLKPSEANDLWTASPLAPGANKFEAELIDEFKVGEHTYGTGIKGALRWHRAYY